MRNRFRLPMQTDFGAQVLRTGILKWFKPYKMILEPYKNLLRFRDISTSVYQNMFLMQT